MNVDVMFSSKSDEYETPQEFFNILNKEFNFTLDPCATYATTKCDKWFGHEFDCNPYDEEFVDGLKQSWQGETVFCNPPYSKVKDWVKKCYEESKKDNTSAVMLIPARTDTTWFHEYCTKGEVRFIKGRLLFKRNGIDPKKSERAPFPSIIVVFRKAV